MVLSVYLYSVHLPLSPDCELPSLSASLPSTLQSLGNAVWRAGRPVRFACDLGLLFWKGGRAALLLLTLPHQVFRTQPSHFRHVLGPGLWHKVLGAPSLPSRVGSSPEGPLLPHGVMPGLRDQILEATELLEHGCARQMQTFYPGTPLGLL